MGSLILSGRIELHGANIRFHATKPTIKEPIALAKPLSLEEDPHVTNCIYTAAQGSQTSVGALSDDNNDEESISLQHQTALLSGIASNQVACGVAVFSDKRANMEQARSKLLTNGLTPVTSGASPATPPESAKKFLQPPPVETNFSTLSVLHAADHFFQRFPTAPILDEVEAGSNPRVNFPTLMQEFIKQHIVVAKGDDQYA